MAKSTDYEVGYGKTPEKTRFRKGQSGNPSGRPKGTQNMATVLRKALREKIWITEGGTRRRISKFDAAVTQMVNRAVKGEARAMQQLISMNGLLNEGSASPASLPSPDVEQVALATLFDRLNAERIDEPSAPAPVPETRPVSKARRSKPIVPPSGDTP